MLQRPFVLLVSLAGSVGINSLLFLSNFPWPSLLHTLCSDIPNAKSRALHNLGRVHSFMGEYEKALE